MSTKTYTVTELLAQGIAEYGERAKAGAATGDDGRLGLIYDEVEARLADRVPMRTWNANGFQVLFSDLLGRNLLETVDGDAVHLVVDEAEEQKLIAADMNLKCSAKKQAAWEEALAAWKAGQAS